MHPTSCIILPGLYSRSLRVTESTGTYCLPYLNALTISSDPTGSDIAALLPAAPSACSPAPSAAPSPAGATAKKCSTLTMTLASRPSWNVDLVLRVGRRSKPLFLYTRVLILMLLPISSSALTHAKLTSLVRKMPRSSAASRTDLTPLPPVSLTSDSRMLRFCTLLADARSASASLSRDTTCNTAFWRCMPPTSCSRNSSSSSLVWPLKLEMMVTFLGAFSMARTSHALLSMSTATVRASTKSDVPVPRGSGDSAHRVSSPGGLSSCSTYMWQYSVVTSWAANSWKRLFFVSVDP
mmetsp:Transcript_37217/g.82781  ORF Transcript_37217/g.82781 Transcript_37217/m.82781 type:complete len:295 (+) Transcript_37217:1586-2470(+)